MQSSLRWHTHAAPLFQFPTDPAEPNIHKRSVVGHLSIEIKRHIMLRIRLEWKISAALSGYSPKSLTNISSQLAFPVANAHRETGRNQTAESYMGMIS